MEREQKKKARKRFFIILFVILNVLVIGWTAFSELSKNEGASALGDVELKWWMLIPALIAFGVSVWALVYKYVMLMRRTKSAASGMTARQIWKVATHTALLGRYYDNVTPASCGGQPFQIYYMHKNEIKDGYDVVLPLVCMIGDMLGLMIIGFVSLILGTLTHGIWSPAIVAFAWLGLLVVAFFPLVIMMATFLPKATEEIIGFGVKFLHKLRIIKDEKKVLDKTVASVQQYAAGVKTILKEKGLFPRVVGLGMVYYIATITIPFFVLMAFGTEINFFACFTTTAAVQLAIYFVPTPGNAGAAEGTFYTVFSVLPAAGYVFWAMLFWRLFVYYGWLALGMIVQLRIYREDKEFKAKLDADLEKLDNTVVEIEAGRKAGR